MKKLMKKSLSLLLTLGLTAGLLAACGGDGKAAEGGASQAGGGHEAADKDEAGSSSDVFKVGVIQFADHPSLENCYKGFAEGLEEKLGADKFEIDYQVAQADGALTNQIAQNFASKQYDLICGIATPAAQAAYNAAKDKGIPVVFNAVTDPVAAQLQNEDGSNREGVTGASDVLPIKAQLKMIRAFLPEAKSIGILYNTGEANSVSSVATYEKLAPDFGFEIITQGITAAADVPTAAQSLVSKADCLTNLTDNTVVQNLATILSKTEAAGIPYFGSEEEQVLNGCIAAEGIDYIALGKITGEMAAEILNGKKPEEIPVVAIEESTPFYNSKVLEAFALTLPEDYKDAADMAK